MNLAALRQYRRGIEDLLRAELAALEHALAVSVHRSRDLEDTLDQTGRRFEADLRGGLSRDDMLERTRALDGQGMNARRAAAAVMEARVRWEHKRAEVVEAAMERKTLELLEERRMRRRLLRRRLLEQQALDEAAHVRFLRRGRAGAHHDA